MTYQQSFTVKTNGKSATEITRRIQDIVRDADIDTGLCHIFQHHTSASLILSENADPAVRHDIETFLSRLVRDGDPMFTHRSEGPDDMSAHIRNVLTGNELTIPVTDSRCNLGVWQGIFLWEHRAAGKHRKVTVTIQGA